MMGKGNKGFKCHQYFCYTIGTKNISKLVKYRHPQFCVVGPGPYVFYSDTPNITNIIIYFMDALLKYNHRAGQN